MKKVFAVFATLILPVVLLAAPKFLTVLHAQKANIDKVGNSYVMRLSNVSNNVLYFSDHPDRLTGQLTLKPFIANWHKSFAKNPPNVAVVHADLVLADKSHQSGFAYELSKPSWQGHELIFQMQRLKGDSALHSRKLQNVYLFIDGAKNLGIGFA